MSTIVKFKNTNYKFPFADIRTQSRKNHIKFVKYVRATVQKEQPQSFSIVLINPALYRQDRHLSVDLSILGYDQNSRKLIGQAHIRSQRTALIRESPDVDNNKAEDAIKSFYAWHYKGVRDFQGSEGMCWIRQYAPSYDSVICSTAIVRKDPVAYNYLYNSQPPSSDFNLQCDMSEHVHIDPQLSLSQAEQLEDHSPLCIEFNFNIKSALNDDYSTSILVYALHNSTGPKQISQKITSQLNGVFHYTNIKDQSDKNFPVSSLYLDRMSFDIKGILNIEKYVFLRQKCEKSLINYKSKPVNFTGTDRKPEKKSVQNILYKKINNVQNIPFLPVNPCIPQQNSLNHSFASMATRQYELQKEVNPQVKAIPDLVGKFLPDLRGVFTLKNPVENDVTLVTSLTFMSVNFQEKKALDSIIRGFVRFEQISGIGQNDYHSNVGIWQAHILKDTQLGRITLTEPSKDIVYVAQLHPTSEDDLVLYPYKGCKSNDEQCQLENWQVFIEGSKFYATEQKYKREDI